MINLLILQKEYSCYKCLHHVNVIYNNGYIIGAECPHCGNNDITLKYNNDGSFTTVPKEYSIDEVMEQWKNN